MDHKLTREAVDKISKAIEGGKIDDQLSSDNSFSENGLENASKLSQVTKKQQ